MILTRAYITGINDNLYTVRVPLMEDHTSNVAEFEAVASNSPGIYNGYNVGDPVIVHFEDHQLNKCIILGRLFTSIPDEDKAFVLANHLKVTDVAELPKNTKINGVSIGDVVETLNNVINISGGNGDVDSSKLRDFVKYEQTQRGNEPYYADLIQVMTGEEYDEKLQTEDSTIENTLFFLTSPSSREE